MSTDITQHDPPQPVPAQEADRQPATAAPLHWVRLLTLVLIAGGLGFWLFTGTGQPTVTTPTDDTEAVGVTEALAELGNDPADLLAVGEQLQRAGRLSEALEVFDRIPQSAGEAAITARVSQASTLLHLGELVKCEEQLHRLEELDPGNDYLVNLRASLLTAAGRRWESLPYLRESLRRDFPEQFTSLIYLANLHAMPAPDEDYFERLYQVGDAYSLLTAARLAASLDMTDRALDLLGRSLDLKPDLVETQIQFGQLLLNSGETAAFEHWQSQLPADAEIHPILWLLRGATPRNRETTTGHCAATGRRCSGTPTRTGPATSWGRCLRPGERAKRPGPFWSGPAVWRF